MDLINSRGRFQFLTTAHYSYCYAWFRDSTVPAPFPCFDTRSRTPATSLLPHALSPPAMSLLPCALSPPATSSAAVRTKSACYVSAAARTRSACYVSAAARTKSDSDRSKPAE
jgi:hypothetical protein